MALTITHTKVVATADDGTSDVGSDEWNAAHTIAGTLDLASQVTGTLAVGNGGTGITSLGTGVATFLGTPSSANLASALTDETGTAGALVFSTAPTLTGPVTLNEAVGSSALTLTGATQTASFPVLNATQTWNNAAVAFTGLKLNVTNTASATSSLLLDLQVGGISGVNYNPAFGILHITSLHNVVNPAIEFDLGASDAFGGKIELDSAGRFIFWDTASTRSFALASSGAMRASNSGSFGFCATADTRNAADTLFIRDGGAGIMALQNSTNAQTLRVYNTFTDASNYERGVFDWTTTANTLTIGTQNLGTGSARNLQFITGGSNRLDFGVSNASAWTFAGANAIVYSGSGSIFFNGLGVGFDGTNARFGPSNSIFWFPSAAYTGTQDTGLSRTVAGVVEINNGTAGTLTGCYLHWGGQARVASDFTVTSSTALVNVTGLSVNVAAGRTYSFEAYISFTCAAAGGIQAAIAGTATATAIEYDGYIVDSAANGIKGNTQATALGTAVATATTTGTAGVVHIFGTITVNAAGTLTVQMAQNTSSGTATTAKRGSWFIVHDMP